MLKRAKEARGLLYLCFFYAGDQKVLSIRGKHSTTNYIVLVVLEFILWQGLTKLSSLAWNLWSACLGSWAIAPLSLTKSQNLQMSAMPS